MSIPHKCSMCNGFKTVTYYLNPTTNIITNLCPTCLGTGLVWDRSDVNQIMLEALKKIVAECEGSSSYHAIIVKPIAQAAIDAVEGGEKRVVKKKIEGWVGFGRFKDTNPIYVREEIYKTEIEANKFADKDPSIPRAVFISYEYEEEV